MTSSPTIFDQTDPDSRLLQALRDLGRAPATNPFDLTWNGVSISVRQTSGSSTSIELRTPYPGALSGTRRRPLQIVLRVEDALDRAAKCKGVSIEAQTGDPEFDDAIYLETPAEPELAARVFSAAPLRAAVLTLLRTGFQDLVLDDERHQIYLRLYATAHIEAWTAQPARLLDLIATLATCAPPHDALPERRADGPVKAVTTALLATGAASTGLVALASTMAPALCRGDEDGPFLAKIGTDSRCWHPWALGVLVGLLLAFAGHCVLAASFRGRADSHRRLISLPLLLLLSCTPLGIAIAMFALWVA